MNAPPTSTTAQNVPTMAPAVPIVDTGNFIASHVFKLVS